VSATCRADVGLARKSLELIEDLPDPTHSAVVVRHSGIVSATVSRDIGRVSGYWARYFGPRRSPPSAALELGE
jgi:hypothetical protein